MRGCGLNVKDGLNVAKCCCQPRQHLQRPCTPGGTWRAAGTAMASCPATVRPIESNGNRREIRFAPIGMAARAFIEDAGTAALRPVLDPDPDWQCLELRSLEDCDHSQIETRRIRQP